MVSCLAKARACSAAPCSAAHSCRRHRLAPTIFAAGKANQLAALHRRPCPARASSSDEQAVPELAAGQQDAAAGAGSGEQFAVLGPRDDDILPDSLTDALEDSCRATVEALERGVDRCIVEILLPELWDPLSGPVYAEEGDQQRFWKLTRRFLDNLAVSMPGKRIRAIYPDVGVSAMLRNQWTDAAFEFAALNDRKPVTEQDDIVVLAAPDPMGADAAIRITRGLAEGQSLVMFNPRLASGDVGVGLAIRRMRDSFLSRFTTTYSLRPIAEVGSVFRRYPGSWQVFVQDPDVQGRYKLVAERLSRPGGEALDYILMEAFGEMEGGEGGKEGGSGGTSFVNQVGLTLSSLQRFMRSLSQ
ncbi:hypothetical protein D9Q98_005141 [Chlorella vulgaris]|uniref:DUF1995 domain-containing protein n=1 Tax=Chlorella vulgaris TaxID=3077 RepID=A0A9D4TNW6_CHLVU|nr:hypothetical protein D9Q98_005141 [Chlorella vulgaris]